MAGSAIIDLVARINTEESEKLIQSQLNGIASNLKLNVKCNIDIGDIGSIKKQLSDLSKSVVTNAVKLPTVVDTGTVKDQAKALSEALDLKFPKGQTAEARQEIQRLIDEYKKFAEVGNEKGANTALKELITYTDKFRKELQMVDEEAVKIQQDIKNLAKQGKPFISEKDFDELKYIFGGDARKASSTLTKAFGVGGWTKDKNKSTTSWDVKVQELNEKGVQKFKEDISGVLELLEYLDKSFDTGAEYVKHYGDQIDEAFGKDVETHLNEILGIVTSLNGETAELATDEGLPDKIESGIKEVKEEFAATTKEVETLGTAIEKTKAIAEGFEDITPPEIKMPDIGLGYSTKDVTENAKSVLNDFFAANTSDDGLSRSVTRVTKAVEDAGEELQRFYVQVERSDKATETLTYAINEQGDAYEYLGKTIREADNSTDFRRKDIGTQWEIQSNKLKQFAQNADKAGLAGTALREDIKSLYEALNRANPDFGGDTSAMNAFLDKFDIAKAKLQAFNTEARKDNASKNLANRIKTLTANMNAYAVANDRAVKSTKEMSNGRSFADEWTRLSTQMAKGAELTDREVKDLTADFRVFGKEAEMAGLKGDSAFGKFLNSFKTMSSYITANMVFNFVKRQIREMVNEVITIDTAMTELRKVTEATNAEFEKFAQNAGKTGKELGATISDVINATSTFSRAGYNLPDAEELGRVATLYKNVGDGINIDTASESLVSILKAFNIEAAESERVLDRINEVSNGAAIESGGLGFALQRVASAMDAANNSLDQTIALVTSANEIVENPEMVAQGWRTVALRIRGAKTELEQAGEDTEGMVESTAKLRDLIKGISGVDIMLDENTFKSTYDIIDELGKVWKNISDINQASLLEAIAGKRQSNIVAATLNNYERLEEILKISENSAGSAMREQEEYSKSIQFSINTLKAAYQDFAQTAIDKGIIKDLLGTAQSFLEVLTKIVDKIGLLPTILGSIAMINGIRGKGKQNRICLFTHRCDLCVEINALKQ